MRIHSTCLLPHDLWGMPALKCYPAIQFDGGSPGARGSRVPRGPQTTLTKKENIDTWKGTHL